MSRNLLSAMDPTAILSAYLGTLSLTIFAGLRVCAQRRRLDLRLGQGQLQASCRESQLTSSRVRVPEVQLFRYAAICSCSEPVASTHNPHAAPYHNLPHANRLIRVSLVLSPSLITEYERLHNEANWPASHAVLAPSLPRIPPSHQL